MLSAKYLDDDIETAFIMTNNKYSLSAPFGIRELAKFGGKLMALFRCDVKEKLEERFNTVHTIGATKGKQKIIRRFRGS